jgi:3-dehydroquinate dehydratase-2
MNIHVLHGPNLNRLGLREPGVYGTFTLAELDQRITDAAAHLGVECVFMQSNIEGELVEAIHRAGEEAQGILINPAAYTHTSVALRDALLSVSIPTVEVHLSNTYARESFRHASLIADIALGRVVGFGMSSYTLGLQALVEALKTNPA